MSYYGKRYDKGPSFDPGNIVQINNTVTLTNATANKTLMLNAPANYAIDLPQLSTMTIGDELNFIHNSNSGNVTLNVYSGDSINLLGIGNTSISLSPGAVIVIQKSGTNNVWAMSDLSSTGTRSQGNNTTATASTAFVINEFGKHKNYLINGNFDIWQRATSLTAATGTRFCADRWITESAGTTVAVSRQVVPSGEIDANYFHRAVVSSVAGAANSAVMYQRIEGVRTLAGKKATLSFYAKADAVKNIGVEFLQYFGTGGSPSALVNAIGVTTKALTTSFTKYTVTVDLPSISGKTIGTNNNDYLVVAFWFDAGSNHNARSGSIGQQSGTFDIAQIQLEEGAVATQFEHRHIALEEMMCQRYYENGDVYFDGAINTSTTARGTTIFFKINKRTTPVLSKTDTSATTFVDDARRERCRIYTSSATLSIISSWTADAEL